jgi:hypothetical protein
MWAGEIFAGKEGGLIIIGLEGMIAGDADGIDMN